MNMDINLNVLRIRTPAWNKPVQFLILFVLIANYIFVSCKKDKEPVYPTITTKVFITGDLNFADFSGFISNDGNVEIKQRGFVWSTSENPTLESYAGYTVEGEGAGEFDSRIVSLSVAVNYYVRAYARTNYKTIYGNSVKFIVLYGPVIITRQASEISWKSARLTGQVNPSYTATIVSVQLGKTTSYGTEIFSTQLSPQLNEIFEINTFVSNLEPNTIYHYRYKAENQAGVAYGDDKTFETKGVVYDVDGNGYSVINIGTQTWLKEDLITRHFNNSDPIPNPIGSKYLTTCGYWEYDDIVYDNDYGLLYNYYTVADQRGICPDGWHVPSYSEYNTLVDHVGSDQGGIKLKEAGPLHWGKTNIADNETDFTALPGGQREDIGWYGLRGIDGIWWSATNREVETGPAQSFSLHLPGGSQAVIISPSYQYRGHMVRCIKGRIPWVLTQNFSDTTATTAVLYGTVKANNAQANVVFEYGYASLQTFDNSASASPGTVFGNDLTSVKAELSGLSPGKEYKYRIRATSPEGTITGLTKKFKTFATPVPTTRYAKNIKKTSATLCGRVTTYFLPARISFEYGTTPAYGNSIVAAENHFAPESLESSISGLIPETIYHYRIVAENSEGTYYGEDKIFRTLNLLEVTDVDGNIYPTVTIGSQVWMGENLKTTRQNDGSAITLVTEKSIWGSYNSPGYCWYDNNESVNKDLYGALYNWWAVNTAKLCPAGWHVPSNEEWNALISYLGSTTVGLKIKDGEAGDRCSWAPSTNETGFTALLGGDRRYDGTFENILYSSRWWSSDMLSSTSAWSFGLDNCSLGLEQGNRGKYHGFSVRCIMD